MFSFHSRTLLQATLALSLVVPSLNSVFCDFSIFSALMPHSPAPFNLVYGIPSYTHYLLSSGTQGTGTYPSAPVAHFKWVCGTLCRRSPLDWSCRRRCWWVGCIYGWLGLGDPSTPIVLPPKWPTEWSHQRSEGSWLFAHQFAVHLEIHRWSPSSPSPLGCWTSTEKGHSLVGPLS